MEALKAGFIVYYTHAHDLIQKLKQAHHENTLTKKLKTLCKYKLLIIDEIGYLPFDKDGANLFFQLISRRYEKLSTVLTSNRAFSEGTPSLAIMQSQLQYLIDCCITAPPSTSKDKATGSKNDKKLG